LLKLWMWTRIVYVLYNFISR